MPKEKEKVLPHAVLIFLIRGKEVLLARKMFHIGAGCWNGYGGGIENGETPILAAKRELEEESGVRVRLGDLELAAEIDFHNHPLGQKPFVCRVSVFLAHQWQGEPKETPEMMTPTWFPISELPLENLMLADPHWLPQVLAGEKILVEAWYGPRQKTLLRPVEICQIMDADVSA